MLRIGPDSGKPWPADDEVREIIKNDPRASGNVYGTDYAIRMAQNQNVHTPLLLPDAPGDTNQAQLREHNPFDSRSAVTSTTTMPIQVHPGCSGQGELPRAASSLLKEARRARNCVRRAGQFID